MSFPANLLVGTSSWSSTDWLGAFYPPNLKPGQFIEAYARKFPAVEIDSTYYSIPPPHVVKSWREKILNQFCLTNRRIFESTFRVIGLPTAADGDEFQHRGLSASQTNLKFSKTIGKDGISRKACPSTVEVPQRRQVKIGVFPDLFDP